MGAPPYPADLERFWMDRAAGHFPGLDAEQMLDQLRPHVARLSDLFTTARPPGFHAYGDDPLVQLAYGLFFFPQTYVRTRLVLEECRAAGRWTPPAGRAARILDLGAGLGAGLLALAHGLDHHPLDLTAVDHSPGSLATLRELFAGQARPVHTHQGDILRPRPGTWDLILCSFALNEAAENQPDSDLSAWTRHLLEQLEPEGLLLIIEPALDAAAARLEALRDTLAAEPRGCIIAPCLHHRPCPLRRENRVYCHEVRRWTAPDRTAFLNRHLFRDLQVLKFCFLAVVNRARPAAEPEATRARLVAPVDLQNGKAVTRGCAADGDVHNYEILLRHLSRAERDRLEELERGSRVQWAELQTLKDGRTLRSAALPAVE